MIEVHLSYELQENIDEQAYFQWLKAAIVPVLKSKGIIEVRALRDAQNPQKVLVIGSWKTFEDWRSFKQSDGWTSLIGPLQSLYALNSRLEVWGPSKLIPVPLRPPK
ncbi:MAG TPA: antibiotic biosynthesis monooxygenase [Smithellaceae bacterium]|nr:antibiotic biosynthesis monooxygenase [Smithellaceae bacterium]